MLSYLSYTLTAVAALVVTCHAECKCPEIPGLLEKDGLKKQLHLTDLLRRSGSLTGPSGRNGLPCWQGLPYYLDTELYSVFTSLKHRVSRLEGVLALTGKITQAGEKIFASNGKNVDFVSALKSCEETGATLAAPMNEEENTAILDIVKKYNQYAYLGIKESETAGKFNYLNGMPLNYTKWYYREPSGKEKCVEMYTDGSWNDRRCDVYRLTVCEF